MIKNYEIFKMTITQTIQNSGLDIGMVYFIMKDVFYELEKTYIRQINKEVLEEKKNTNSNDPEVAKQ